MLESIFPTHEGRDESKVWHGAVVGVEGREDSGSGELLFCLRFSAHSLKTDLCSAASPGLMCIFRTESMVFSSFGLSCLWSMFMTRTTLQGRGPLPDRERSGSSEFIGSSRVFLGASVKGFLGFFLGRRISPKVRDPKSQISVHRPLETVQISCSCGSGACRASFVDFSPACV